MVKQECCIRKIINLKSGGQSGKHVGLLGSSFKSFMMKVFTIKAL